MALYRAPPVLSRILFAGLHQKRQGTLCYRVPRRLKALYAVLKFRLSQRTGDCGGITEGRFKVLVPVFSPPRYWSCTTTSSRSGMFWSTLAYLRALKNLKWKWQTIENKPMTHALRTFYEKYEVHPLQSDEDSSGRICYFLAAATIIVECKKKGSLCFSFLWGHWKRLVMMFLLIRLPWITNGIATRSGLQNLLNLMEFSEWVSMHCGWLGVYYGYILTGPCHAKDPLLPRRDRGSNRKNSRKVFHRYHF